MVTESERRPERAEEVWTGEELLLFPEELLGSVPEGEAFSPEEVLYQLREDHKARFGSYPDECAAQE